MLEIKMPLTLSERHLGHWPSFTVYIIIYYLTLADNTYLLFILVDESNKI
ncbi:MAG: hypothetical protein ACI9U5_001952 [Colwellia sp.]|jgi:hypothetical protein